MKRCIACGMPMKELSDFPDQDNRNDYCNYCARADGSMQSFEEKRENWIDFIIKTQGFDQEASKAIVENNMKKLPAWKKYFSEEG